MHRKIVQGFLMSDLPLSVSNLYVTISRILNEMTELVLRDLGEAFVLI